jgi:3-hydroxybutyryl-CoA dehydrogenase
MKLTQVGVVGAGNIGVGVVTDLVLHGINAVLVDLSDETLKKAEAEVAKNIRFRKACPRSHAKRPRSASSSRRI